MGKKDHPLKDHPLFWMWDEGVFEKEPLSNLEEEQPAPIRPAHQDGEPSTHHGGYRVKESGGWNSNIPAEVVRLSKAPTHVSRRSNREEEDHNSD